ncbi:MAG: acyl-CoA dehydrogenase [Hoeflea sp.]|uniref:acyl-CoA dehydrogenase family protein n=1 Tax=Hoeflea sp. TaxID=1940281 RepID=UPI000C0F38B8|nr:acyl-CoA dehydrogenase [Hoeflea sp.]PHR20681.1 MAG: acyl-CoA dehydrogenase [Hoeflea sp.]
MNAPRADEDDQVEFNLSDEQRMLRDSALRMLQAKPVGLPNWAAAPAGFDPARWAEVAELGWLALMVPADDDGLGGSLADAAILAEEFGRGLLPAPFISSAVLATGIVAAAPAGDVRSGLLGELAAGTKRLALATDEPSGASGAESVETIAVQDDGWRLTGRKILVIDGVGADGFLVTAVPTGADGPAVFYLPATAEGLRIRSYRFLDGRTVADLIMEGAVCEGGPLIDPNAATDDVEAALDAARVAMAAEAQGLMERAIADTREYVGQRKQFGRTLAEFQSIRHRLADMFVESQNSRAMLFRALHHADAAPAVRAAAVSATMLAVARAGEMIGGQAIQLHGGIGMTEEYAVGHCYKRLRVIAMIWGDRHFHMQRYRRLSPLTREGAGQ